MWKCVYSDQSPLWKYTEARKWKEERREEEKQERGREGGKRKKILPLDDKVFFTCTAIFFPRGRNYHQHFITKIS